jgi:hypothetical protein
VELYRRFRVCLIAGFFGESFSVFPRFKRGNKIKLI